MLYMLLFFHYTACNEECSDSGLGLCTGNLSTECCDFYHDNSCVVECPTDTVPNDDFNCVCKSVALL